MCVLTDTIMPRWHASLAMQKCPFERTLVSGGLAGLVGTAPTPPTPAARFRDSVAAPFCLSLRPSDSRQPRSGRRRFALRLLLRWSDLRRTDRNGAPIEQMRDSQLCELRPPC